MPPDTFTHLLTQPRADLIALLEADMRETGIVSPRDLTVKEVAKETDRAPSTVRDWLLSGALRGYKFNDRDWRVPRAALEEYLDAQSKPTRSLRRRSSSSGTGWERSLRGCGGLGS